MYRFRELDISGVGPFGASNVLRFGEGLTYISGGNGLGKTTIVRALRGEFPNARTTFIGHLPSYVPCWVMYFDESLRLPSGGGSWTPLTTLKREGTLPKLDWNLLENGIAAGVRELLEEKVPKSKFSGTIVSSSQIDLTLGQDGCINVVDGISGRDLSWGFQAMGEQAVLYLAINRALRTASGDDLEVPFVVDSCFGSLDMTLRPAAQSFIEKMAAQVIILENNNLYEDLRLRPDFEIRLDRSGKSYITSRQSFTGDWL